MKLEDVDSKDLLRGALYSAVRLAITRHNIELEPDTATEEEVAEDAAGACFGEECCDEIPIPEVTELLRRLSPEPPRRCEKCNEVIGPLCQHVVWYDETGAEHKRHAIDCTAPIKNEVAAEPSPDAPPERQTTDCAKDFGTYQIGTYKGKPYVSKGPSPDAEGIAAQIVEAIGPAFTMGKEIDASLADFKKSVEPSIRAILRLYRVGQHGVGAEQPPRELLLRCHKCKGTVIYKRTSPFEWEIFHCDPAQPPASAQWVTAMNEHWPTLQCDHVNSRDMVICSCSKVNLGWHKNIGLAIKSWSEHVREIALAAPPQKEEKQ